MMKQNRQKIWDSHVDTWSKLRGKHVFLTGGTGFFGKSFLDLINDFNAHQGLDLKITILARSPEKFKNEFPHLSTHKWINFVQGDIVNFEFQNLEIDYILHFANPANSKLNHDSPLEIFDVIYRGTLRVLEFAKVSRVRAILQTSSGAIYGKQPTDISHVAESFLGSPSLFERSSSYGEGKRAAEMLGNIYSDLYGIEHKVARCFAFTGPYLDLNGSYAIGNFIRDAIDNKKIVISGDGSDLRSYMYSDDLVMALVKVLIDGKNNFPYNVGSDQIISIKDLAHLVKNVLKSEAEVEIKKKADPAVLPNRYVPSIDLLKNELKINLITSMEDAIKLTAQSKN